MAGKSPLDGLRVLVVEDEALIALDLQQTLLDLGCAIVRLAHRKDDVRALMGAKAVDFAILDVMLADGMSYPIADALTELGVPFIFATGFESVDDRYRHVPLIEKPFTGDDLVAAVQLAIQLSKNSPR